MKVFIYGTTKQYILDFLRTQGHELFISAHDDIHTIIKEVIEVEPTHILYFASEANQIEGVIFDTHTTELNFMNDDRSMHGKLTLNIGTEFIDGEDVGNKYSSDSISVMSEMLPLMVELMQERTTGVYNLMNKGSLNRCDFIDMYKEIMDVQYENKDAYDFYYAPKETGKLETSDSKEAVRRYLQRRKDKWDDENTVLMVTGSAGFIGSAFCNYYFPRNHFKLMIGFDAMYYCANEKNIKEEIRNDKRFLFVKGNLRSEDLVTYILNTHKVTKVIHFAAQSFVGTSFENSLNFTYDNIVATHILLECMRKYGKVNKIIICDTDESYGHSAQHIDEEKKTEHSILMPTNPYAATKAATSLISQSYYHSFKMPISISRGNNVYGMLDGISAQYPEKLIPKFIKLLKEGKKVTLEDRGIAVRAFLHIYDTVRAFEIILKSPKTIGNIYNIGCDEDMEYSVMDVAKMLIRMIKKTEDYDQWIEYIENRPFQDLRYYISNQKLKDLGWNITVKFEDGLREMVEMD